MIDDNILNQSLFIKEWVNDNIAYFKLQYPNASEEKLREILMGIAKKNIKNATAYLHNDYQDDMRIDADLLTIYDWYKKTNPIAANVAEIISFKTISSPFCVIICLNQLLYYFF